MSNVGIISIHGPNQGLQNETIGAPCQGAGIVIPIIVYTKNISARMDDTSVDIATIKIPPKITRWRLSGLATVPGIGGCTIVTESALLSAGNSGLITCWDAPNGTGNQLTVVTTISVTQQSTTVPVFTTSPAIPMAISTSNTIYVRQTQKTIWPVIFSIYITIFPLP